MDLRYLESEEVAQWKSWDSEKLVEPEDRGENHIASSWCYSIREGLDNHEEELRPGVW